MSTFLKLVCNGESFYGYPEVLDQLGLVEGQDVSEETRAHVWSLNAERAVELEGSVALTDAPPWGSAHSATIMPQSFEKFMAESNPLLTTGFEQAPLAGSVSTAWSEPTRQNIDTKRLEEDSARNRSDLWEPKPTLINK